MMQRRGLLFPILIALVAACSSGDVVPDEVRDESPGDTASVVSSAAGPVNTVLSWPADQLAGQPTGEEWALLARAPNCGVAPILLTPDSIGPLHLGISVSELVAQCPGGLARWDWGDEGIPEPALFVRVGEGLVQLVFSDTLRSSPAYRVQTNDPSFRTRQGVGVGSNLATLREHYGAPRLAEGECVLYATFETLAGLSFRLDLPGAVECAQLYRYVESPTLLPSDAVVRRVHLYRRPADA
jgi:hypothetical protein